MKQLTNTGGSSELSLGGLRGARLGQRVGSFVIGAALLFWEVPGVVVLCMTRMESRALVEHNRKKRKTGRGKVEEFYRARSRPNVANLPRRGKQADCRWTVGG